MIQHDLLIIRQWLTIWSTLYFVNKSSTRPFGVHRGEVSKIQLQQRLRRLQQRQNV